jgi:hypothetical protein
MRSTTLCILSLLCILICSCGCLSLPSSGDLDVFEYSSPMEKNAGWDDEVASYAPAPVQAVVEASSGGTSASDVKVIKTACLNLDVTDVGDVLAEIKSIAAQQGGYLSSSNAGDPGSTGAYATAVLRVPADHFDSAMEGVRVLGTVRSQTVNNEDVTEEYVDLQARLGALEHQYDQYSRIMEKAETVEDILHVQVEMERVQVEIERITGRMRYLDNRIDLATITVHLREPTPVGADVGHDFAAVFNAAIEAFLFTIDAIIILLFMLLPLIVIGGGCYGIYRWRKSKKTEKNEPGEN